MNTDSTDINCPKAETSPRNDTRKAILQAAEREFFSKGFAGARTTAIAEAAGVNHAMLHYYFRTKAKLFEHVIEEKLTLLKETLIAPASDNSSSLAETIRHLIESHLKFVAEYPDMPRFILSDILYHNPERGKVFTDGLHLHAPKLIAALQNKIDHEAKQGKCRQVDAKMLMLDIASLNIFPFVAAPAVDAALGGILDDRESFIEQRIQENYDTIMRKLQIETP